MLAYWAFTVRIACTPANASMASAIRQVLLSHWRVLDHLIAGGDAILSVAEQGLM